jgi:TRAP-type C4-dicarboxylate transport system permease small subunit
LLPAAARKQAAALPFDLGISESEPSVSERAPVSTQNPTLARTFDLTDRALLAIEKGTIWISCASLFVIMTVIFVDATLRYSINRPLTITADVVNLYLLNAALLLVLAYTLRRGGHIGVEQFALLMPKRLYHLLSGAALICCTVVVGVMAAEAVELSWDSWSQNELMIGIWPWPIWASKVIVALSIVVLELRLIHIGATHFFAGLLNNPAIAIPLVAEASEEGV